METGKRYSRKRAAIMECLKSTTIHPTAEWIYEQLKPEIPDLSLGTVYRNLAAFKKDGLIRSVGVVNGQERYDGNIRPHGHFVCSKCGAVIDTAAVPMSEELIESTEGETGCEVQGIVVSYFGLCSNCLKEQEKYR